MQYEHGDINGVRCRDVSRGTCSQFEQPVSYGWGTEWHESGAKLAVETEFFHVLLRVEKHFRQDPHTSSIQAILRSYSALYLTDPVVHKGGGLGRLPNAVSCGGPRYLG